MAAPKKRRTQQKLIHGLARSIYGPITEKEQEAITENYGLMFGEALAACRRFNLPTGEAANVVNGWCLPKMVDAIRHHDANRGKLSTLFCYSCRRDGRSLRLWVKRNFMTRATALSVDAMTKEDSSPDWWHPVGFDAYLGDAPPNQITLTSEQLHELVDELPERARRIVEERFWGRKTLQVLADEEGLSRERIRQIVLLACKLLRDRLNRGEKNPGG